MKRERKQSRLQWFALDVDAFFEDPRMDHLDEREKMQWLYLIAKSWRKETIPDSIGAIRNIIGCSKSDSENLRNKLITHRLLIYDGTSLYSPRLRKEQEIAKSAYKQKVDAGKRSAEERAKLLKEYKENVNGRSNAR